MLLTSILALTDFSVDGDKALARAGQIALGHGAVLRLMYVPSRRPLECQDPDGRLAQTARAMALRLGLTVRTAEGGNGSHAAIVAQAAQAQLLVLPQHSEPGFLSCWTAMRRLNCSMRSASQAKTSCAIPKRKPTGYAVAERTASNRRTCGCAG